MTAQTDGRAVAWVGMWGGLIASLASNEAHTWRDGYPGLGHSLWSFAPPLAFFLGLEMVCRYRHILRGWTWAVFLSIVLPAAGVSYWAIQQLTLSYGWGVLSWVAPLMVDGVMAGSTVVLTRLRSQRPARVPRVKTAAVPVSRPPARQDTPAVPAVPNADTAAVPATAPVPATDDRVAKAMRLLSEGRSKPDIAEVLGVSVRTLNRLLAAGRPESPSPSEGAQQ